MWRRSQQTSCPVSCRRKGCLACHKGQQKLCLVHCQVGGRLACRSTITPSSVSSRLGDKLCPVHSECGGRPVWRQQKTEQGTGLVLSSHGPGPGLAMMVDCSSPWRSCPGESVTGKLLLPYTSGRVEYMLEHRVKQHSPVIHSKRPSVIDGYQASAFPTLAVELNTCSNTESNNTLLSFTRKGPLS